MNKNTDGPSTCDYTMHPTLSQWYWDMINIPKGSVLDVGAGMGGISVSKPDSIDLYGIERDDKAIKKLKLYKDVCQLDLNVVNKIPYNDSIFEAVIARDILEHIESPWIIVDEIYRVMKQGSVLVCSVPRADPKVVWNDYTHIRGFTKSSLVGLLNNSGFEVISVYRMGYYTIAPKFHITKLLPYIGRIPILNYFMPSYQAIAIKR